MEPETKNNNAVAVKFRSQLSKYDNHQYETEKLAVVQDFNPHINMLSRYGLINGLSPGGKKNSFLIFKNHKYFTVPTKSIAFFYVKYGATLIRDFDGNEYSIKYSLREVEQLVAPKQFFRLNRQYLVNFSAIEDTEHYFARKLLVNLNVTSPEKLLINKESATVFLQWLEER